MTNILILDGGLGTSLDQQYGIVFDDSKPLWSSHLLLNDQDTLGRCQKDFGDVPVDIILTATYQLSPEAFEGIIGNDGSMQLQGAIRDAVKIAEAAKREHARVALSVGPYGATMRPSQEYSGQYDSQMNNSNSLYQWHHHRLSTFGSSIPEVHSRISFVALETIPRVDEIKAVRQAMANTPKISDIPYWISCLFPGEDGNLPDGSTAQEALESMLDPEVSDSIPWAVGINCTKVWKLRPLLRSYEGAITKMLSQGKMSHWPSLVLYPDGTNGEVYDTLLKEWVLPKEPLIETFGSWEDQLAEVVWETCEKGQWPTVVVGGCCMASAAHIQRLRERLLSSRSPTRALG